MEQLARSVKAMLQHRNVDIVNRCTPSSLTDAVADHGTASNLPRQSSDADSNAAVECTSSTAAATISLAETLITQLVLVLSDGLWPGLDIWSVLVTLERCQNLTSPSLAHSYRFASQMILLIRSSFASASECIKTRAFMRCALNQGCLLAALEVLGRQFQPILEGYMMDQAVLRQYSTSSDKWDRFVRVVAPIAGPPLDLFVVAPPHNNARSGGGGVSNDSLSAAPLVAGPVRFDLDLVVPEFDYCKAYMNDVKLYIAGLSDVACPPVLPIRIIESAPPSAERPPSDAPDDANDTTDNAPRSLFAVEPAPHNNIYVDPAKGVETPRNSSTAISSTTGDGDESPRTTVDPTLRSASTTSPQPKAIKRTVRKVVVTKRIVKRSNGSIVSSSSMLPTTTTTTTTTTDGGDGMLMDETVDDGQQAASPRLLESGLRCAEEGEGRDQQCAALVDDDALEATPSASSSAHTGRSATNDVDPAEASRRTNVPTTDVLGVEKESGCGDPEMEVALDILEQLITRRRAAIEGAISEYERTEEILDREIRLLEVQLGA